MDCIADMGGISGLGLSFQRLRVPVLGVPVSRSTVFGVYKGRETVCASDRQRSAYELLSKLLVSLLISPIVVPYIIPYITPL